jgi:hypothetical protein
MKRYRIWNDTETFFKRLTPAQVIEYRHAGYHVEEAS